MQEPLMQLVDFIYNDTAMTHLKKRWRQGYKAKNESTTIFFLDKLIYINFAACFNDYICLSVH